jgi:hypothetical protein
MNALIAWMLTLMVSHVTPGKTFIPEAKETAEEAIARYESIARDAVAVAYDPTESPLYSGERGREGTFVTMMSIAFWESGFRKDIDLGLGDKARGDGGKSWCMAQIQLTAPEAKTQRRIVMDGAGWKFSETDGWTGQDLVQDRKKCFRAQLHMIRVSFAACAKLPSKLDRLGLYTSGTCVNEQKQSRTRLSTAHNWFEKAPKVPDADVQNDIKPSGVQLTDRL